ncbi:MAG: ankyrin repeat domain-containing protein [Anaerolineae bacterium]
MSSKMLSIMSDSDILSSQGGNLLRALQKSQLFKKKAAPQKNPETFFYAIRSQNQQAALQFLELGIIDLDAIDENGRTALHWACAAGLIDLVKTLIQEGADLDATDEMGQTPFHLACQYNQVEMVKALIQNYSIDINQKDQSDRTPLHCAWINGHLQLAEELTSNGALIDVYQGKGAAPLHWAVEMGYVDLVRQLLSHKQNPNIVHPSNGNTPLHLACISGSSMLSRQLLEANASVSVKNSRGASPLFNALSSIPVNIELIAMLLEKGADPNEIFPNERTPLLEALDSNNLELLQLLLKHGASLKTPSPEQLLSILFGAHIKGHTEIVKLLNRQGIDFNAHTSENFLCLAAEQGHLDIAKLLLAKGADINTKNRHGKTPLALACNAGHLKLVNLLIKTGADIKGLDTDLLRLACQNQNIDLVELLIKRGADVNASLNQDEAPLLVASRLGSSKIVQLLIHHGADLKIQNNAPLSLACYGGDVDLIKLLIRKGADVNVMVNEKETPLHIACRLGHFKLVKLLLSAKADIHAKDHEGGTPKYQALLHGFKNCADLIIGDSYCEERLQRKLLSHFNSLKGTTIIGTEEMRLEGGRAELMNGEIAKSLQTFPNDPQQDFSNEHKSLLTQAFTEASNGSRSARATLSNIQAGKLVILPAGWKKHAIDIVFYKGKIVICNRGRGSKKYGTFYPLDINPQALDEALIQKMLDRNFEKDAGLTFYYSTLPQKLSSNKPEDLICKMLKRYALKYQRIGNCSFASGKAALVCAATLLEMDKAPIKDEPHLEAAAIKIEQAIDQWSTHARLSSLTNYLSYLQKKKLALEDPDLVKEAWKKTKRRIKKRKENKTVSSANLKHYHHLKSKLPIEVIK